MTAQLHATELVKQMVGKNTLNGWDVLVSYNEDQINELLSMRSKSIKGLLTRLNFTTEEKKRIVITKSLLRMNFTEHRSSVLEARKDAENRLEIQTW